MYNVPNDSRNTWSSHGITIALCGLLLLSSTNSAVATPFNDNEPSADKQRFCERLVRQHGFRSYHINDYWQGKGVRRPRPSDWHLIRIKEPWLFSSELFYVYEQTTSDGFTHTAYCKWQKDGYVEMFVNQFEYGGSLMCYSYGENDGMGC